MMDYYSRINPTLSYTVDGYLYELPQNKDFMGWYEYAGIWEILTLWGDME